jgi:hypothetical protein
MPAALRFVALVLLAFWIGGLATLGFVAAPVLFAVLPAHDPEMGRTLAGIAFGAVFESFERWSLVTGGLVAAVLAIGAMRTPRPRRLALRASMLALMLTATVVTAVVIAPRIDAIRVSTPTTIADLPDTDPVKITFGRLHGTSAILMLATMAGGLSLMWMEMQEIEDR